MFPPPQGPGFDHGPDEDGGDDGEDGDGGDDGDDGDYGNDDDYDIEIEEEEYEFTLDEITGDAEFPLDRCTICNGLWIDCFGCQPQAQVDLQESTPFLEHARAVRRRQRRAHETEAEREERIHVRNQRRLNPPSSHERAFWEETSEEGTSEEDEQGEGEQVGREDETIAVWTNCSPQGPDNL